MTTASFSFTPLTQAETTILDPYHAQPSGPPKWLIGLVISWFAFGFVIAVVLLLAQFPKRFPGWTAITGQRRPSARPRGLRQAAESRARATSSAVENRDRFGGVEIGSGKEGENFRMRKPRGLSVDTTGKRKQEASGLGILMPAEEDDDKLEKGVRKVKKRVSFDSTATAIRAKTTGHSSSATAPLPQRKKSFVSSPLSREADISAESDSEDEEDDLNRADIESNHPQLVNSCDLKDRYGERRVSPYNDGNEGSVVAPGHDGGSSKKDSWLENMNRGAAKMVDRLAVAFYDRVEGAEEGLMLPVRESEREGRMGRSVD